MSAEPLMSDASLFDPNAAGFDEDPYPVYSRLRSSAPVYYWPEAGGYLVSRYEDVIQVLHDRRFTSSPPPGQGNDERLTRLPEEYRMLSEFFLGRLPADIHLRVRRAAAAAFTPRAVERLRPDVQAVIDKALWERERQSEIDIPAFANRIPLSVMARMLRIPEEHDETFRRFGQAIIVANETRLTEDQLVVLLQPVPEGTALLRSIIAERRKSRNPGEDLLSVLLSAEDAGTLSDQETLSLIASLIASASDTTVHFICFAMLNLLRRDEQLQRIRADMSLLPGFLEEVLRHDSFGKGGLVRYAAEDIELHGVEIRKGQLVLALQAAALRDPAGYTCPDQFDPERRVERNLNFGLGPHYCLGANLARVEGEMAVATLLERFAHLSIIDGPRFAWHPFFRKMSTLRVAVSNHEDEADQQTSAVAGRGSENLP